jgi:hypothetical protein
MRIAQAVVAKIFLRRHCAMKRVALVARAAAHGNCNAETGRNCAREARRELILRPASRTERHRFKPAVSKFQQTRRELVHAV